MYSLRRRHCRSKEQLAKALAQDQFEYLREALGIINIDIKCN
jgi:hypothetical protein